MTRQVSKENKCNESCLFIIVAFSCRNSIATFGKTLFELVVVGFLLDGILKVFQGCDKSAHPENVIKKLQLTLKLFATFNKKVLLSTITLNNLNFSVNQTIPTIFHLFEFLSLEICRNQSI